MTMENEHRPNIMVVDDTPANLKLLEDMLQTRGCRVIPFLRGQDALAAAANEPPDLILLDINMPEMDGYEVCRQLKSNAKLSAIPVIFISALNETMDKVNAFNCGGVDYVTKPFQFEEVCARVRTHLELQRQKRELQEKNERFKADLELAREFQISLLRARLPLIHAPGQAIRFTHYYEATGSVGGDFFNIIPISTNEVGVFVCDVMGHGVRAALVTAIIRGLVEEVKPSGRAPEQLIRQMNAELVKVLQETGSTMFASAVYLMADIHRGRLLYTNAGHPKPFHLRRSMGLVEPLQFPDHGIGPLLGLFEDAAYVVTESEFAAGDAIFCYTDGVFEARNRNDEQYGEERLLAVVKKHQDLPLEQIYTRVLAEIREFSAGVGFDDDVCMVGFEWVRGEVGLDGT